LNALARSKYAFTVCAAIAVLAGCGGSGSPIGLNGLPGAQNVAPGMRGTQDVIPTGTLKTLVIVTEEPGCKKPFAKVGAALTRDGWLFDGGVHKDRIIKLGLTSPTGRITWMKIPDNIRIWYQAFWVKGDYVVIHREGPFAAGKLPPTLTSCLARG